MARASSALAAAGERLKGQSPTLEQILAEIRGASSRPDDLRALDYFEDAARKHAFLGIDPLSEPSAQFIIDVAIDDALAECD